MLLLLGKELLALSGLGEKPRLRLSRLLRLLSRLLGRGSELGLLLLGELRGDLLLRHLLLGELGWDLLLGLLGGGGLLGRHLHHGLGELGGQLLLVGDLLGAGGVAAEAELGTDLLGYLLLRRSELLLLLGSKLLLLLGSKLLLRSKLLLLLRSELLLLLCQLLLLLLLEQGLLPPGLLLLHQLVEVESLSEPLLSGVGDLFLDEGQLLVLALKEGQLLLAQADRHGLLLRGLGGGLLLLLTELGLGELLLLLLGSKAGLLLLAELRLGNLLLLLLLLGRVGPSEDGLELLLGKGLEGGVTLWLLLRWRRTLRDKLRLLPGSLGSLGLLRPLLLLSEVRRERCAAGSLLRLRLLRLDGGGRGRAGLEGLLLRARLLGGWLAEDLWLGLRGLLRLGLLRGGLLGGGLLLLLLLCPEPGLLLLLRLEGQDLLLDVDCLGLSSLGTVDEGGGGGLGTRGLLGLRLLHLLMSLQGEDVLLGERSWPGGGGDLGPALQAQDVLLSEGPGARLSALPGGLDRAAGDQELLLGGQRAGLKEPGYANPDNINR